MKKFILKSSLFSVIFFGIGFVMIRGFASLSNVTSGTPLTAGNWNDMVKNFFWGSGSGGIYYNGKVGIGTNSPNKDLHIYDTTNNAEIDLQSVAGTNKHWAIYQDKTNSNLYMWNTTNRVSVTTGGIFTVDGTITATNGLCLAGTCKTNWNQVGSSATLNYTGTCDSAHKGATGIISNIFKYCDGTTWIALKPSIVDGTQTNPGLNCNDIKISAGTTTNGIYRIKPDSYPAFQVYCDMSTDTYGRIRVLNAVSASTDYVQATWADVVTNGKDNATVSTTNGRLAVSKWPILGTKLRQKCYDQAYDASWDFTVNSSNSYALTWGNTQFSTYNNGMKLSTRDVDNDLRGNNCSKYTGAEGSGWGWHNSCHAGSIIRGGATLRCLGKNGATSFADNYPDTHIEWYIR